MKTTNKYILSVRKSNRDIDIQKYLEYSEKGGNTINLSGRNSIKYNKSLRRRNKIEKILESALKKVAIVLLIVLGIQIVSASMNNEVEEVKKELLKEQKISTIDDKKNLLEPIRTIEEPQKNLLEPVIDPDEQVIQEAMKVIIGFESLHTKAYWDVKRYSIGCGTISYKDEVINMDEAKKRCREYIGTKLIQINRLADGISSNKKVALLSFMHNVGYKGDVLRYAAKGDDKSVIYLMSLYNSAGGVFMQGLQNRRYSEINIYKS